MKKAFFCCALCLFVSILLFSQKTIYVRPLPMNGDGTTWQQAFNSLSFALNAAKPNDTIWIASGTYTPSTNSTDRNSRFNIPTGVALYGGFNGTETSLSQRPSGSQAYSVLSGNIGNVTDSTDNVYTVVYMAYPNLSNIMDGFIIEHGYAKTDTSSAFHSPSLSGGGVYIESSYGYGFATFNNCIFRNNYARGYGAGIYIRGVNTLGNTPKFTNCAFVNNKASRGGAGLYWTGGSNIDRGIEFLKTTFDSNIAAKFGQTTYSASTGGMILHKTLGNDPIDFLHCNMKGNLGELDAGFLFLPPVNFQKTILSFDSCYVSKCKTEFNGNSFLNYEHVAISLHSNIKINISNCIFKENRGVYSDIGVYSGSFFKGVDTIDIFNNVFSLNRPSGVNVQRDGYDNSNYQLHGNLFIDNENINNDFTFVDTLWSVFSNNFIRNNSLYDLGIYLGGRGNQLVFNNVFYENSCNSTSGLYDSQYLNNIFYNNRIKVPWPYGMTSSSNEFHSNVFVGNIDSNNKAVFPFLRLKDSGFFNQTDSTVFSSNYIDISLDTLIKYKFYGGGNQFGNMPEFTNADSLNFYPTGCSPLIDKGANAAILAYNAERDILGNLRIQNSIVDIGAVETAAVSANMLGISTKCYNDSTGKIQLLNFTGCSPYQITWNTNGKTGSDSIGLKSGFYNLTITDAQGKTFFDSVSINNAPEILVDFDVVNASWSGGTNGSVKAEVLGGTAPYSFLWSTGDTTHLLEGLLPGFYQITITDADGCSQVFEIEIGGTTSTDEHDNSEPGFFIQTDAINQKISVRSTFSGSAVFECFDVTGRRLFSSAIQMGQNDLNEQYLPSGVYLYHIIVGQKIAGSGKLVLQN